MRNNGTTWIHEALDGFLESREGARRFHPAAIGKEVDPQNCFADWLTLARAGQREAIRKKYWAKVQKAEMIEESGSQGGYLVPPSLSDGLMRDLSTGSLWRKWGAFVQPMTRQQIQMPIPDVSTVQTAGTAPYFGGFLLQWLAEAQTFPVTAGMNFREVTLTANELGGTVNASKPFLQDSVGVEAWLTRLFGRGAAWYQDLAFFQGNGVGKPLGVINAPGAVTINRGTQSTVSVGDAQAMVAQLLPSAWEEGAVWFCHPTALAKITAFSGWFANGPLQLHGLPVVPTGKCSTLGTKGDLILAAPSLYLIGDRLQFELAFAPEEPTAWKNNQAAIRAFCRVDGQPAISTPITLSDAASTVSPFIILN